MSKVCSRCNLEKDDSCFRQRTEKRKTKGNFTYLNNTCIDCDTELAREYREKRKNDPAYKKKHAKWATEYYWRNREKVMAYNKKRRATPAAKKKMKVYREKNKNKIYQQEVITKKRYHEKNRDALTDKYLINLLKSQGNANPTEEQIEIKRNQVLLFRIKEKIAGKQIGKTKKCNICNKQKDLCEFWKAKPNSEKRVAFCRECGKIKNNQNQYGK